MKIVINIAALFTLLISEND